MGGVVTVGSARCCCLVSLLPCPTLLPTPHHHATLRVSCRCTRRLIAGLLLRGVPVPPTLAVYMTLAAARLVNEPASLHRAGLPRSFRCYHYPHLHALFSIGMNRRTSPDVHALQRGAVAGFEQQRMPSCADRRSHPAAQRTTACCCGSGSRVLFSLFSPPPSSNAFCLFFLHRGLAAVPGCLYLFFLPLHLCLSCASSLFKD